MVALAALAAMAVDERERSPRHLVHEPAPLHEEVLEVVASQGEEVAQPPARRGARMPARILHAAGLASCETHARCCVTAARVFTRAYCYM